MNVCLRRVGLKVSFSSIRYRGFMRMASSKTIVNWAHPSEASSAFDLRSDTMTIPTLSMLKALSGTTHGDDIMGEDEMTTTLEKEMAELTEKEAGLFVLSGTMGNQLGLRALLSRPPYGILCDERAHIVNYEAGSASQLSGALMKGIKPKNEHHLTLSDLLPHVTTSNDIHNCPTQVISLENTINGLIHPLESIQEISEYAHTHNIKMHCDGARLWEASIATGTPIANLCAPFDTVTMCFSKGLGAPIGSILVGSKQDIAYARRMRKAIGGGIRQPGVLTTMARIAIQEVFHNRRLGETHRVAKRVAEIWEWKGGRVTMPVETNMVWLDLDGAGIGAAEFVDEMAKEGLKTFGSRLVIHYQATDQMAEWWPKIQRVFTKVLETKRKGDVKTFGKTNMYSSK